MGLDCCGKTVYTEVSLIMIWLLIPLALVVFVFAFTYQEYCKVFHVRGRETTAFYDYFFSQYPALKVRAFSCLSGKETLAGMQLTYTEKPKALVVMVHGYGWNMEHYFPQTEFFARAGYLVVIFDGMGMGRSSGKNIHGLPQHMLDTAAVLDYVGADPMLSSLPLLLYGHSWGGYAADAVLCCKPYPVRAIVSVSAYNEPLAAMAAKLRSQYGSALSRILIVPPAIFQRMSFGAAAGFSAVSGLGRAECPVLVAHSREDAVVLFGDNYKKILEAHQGKPNFRFLALEGSNHNIGIPYAVNEQRLQLQRELRRTEEQEALRKELWEAQMMIDEDVLTQFAAFFDESLQFSVGESKLLPA